MGSIFDRGRIRFSCFRYASDEIWTVPWRGATGYFCNNGGLRKMAYPLGALSRFDAKLGNPPKNKNPAKPGKFFVFPFRKADKGARLLLKHRSRSENIKNDPNRKLARASRGAYS